jgi:hypothetical protein
MSSPANRHRPCGRSSLSLALLFLPPFQLLYRSVAAYGRELLLWQRDMRLKRGRDSSVSGPIVFSTETRYRQRSLSAGRPISIEGERQDNPVLRRLAMVLVTIGQDFDQVHAETSYRPFLQV